jgi:hypothetical protein
MVTIRNSEIYGNGQGMPPVLAALQDISRQRISREVGKRLRKLAKAVDAQVEDISAEHKRLIEAHARRDENGEPVPVAGLSDLEDVEAFNRAWADLLMETFEVEEAIPENLLDGLSLQGATWLSPIVGDGETEKKGSAAGS